MARLPLPPSPPALTAVKKEPDVDTTAVRTPGSLSHWRRRLDRLPVTPTQPLLTLQTILSGTPGAGSFTVKRCGELGLTPMTVPTSIKREPDADAGACKDARGKTLGTVTPPHKKHRRHCPPATSIQPLFTPQTTLSDISRADSSVDKWSEQPGPTPMTTHASVKREPCTDTGKDAGGTVAERRRPYPHARPTAAEAPTMWVNRRRLRRLLHNLVRTHRWRDAAGMFSVLLPDIQHPDSFEEARSIFVAAMDIHRRLAEDDGIQLGGRSRYYLRTQKVFDAWIRRLIWLPICAKNFMGKGHLLGSLRLVGNLLQTSVLRADIFAKAEIMEALLACERCLTARTTKHLVKLKLALFYLSQGNIDNAYNSTRTLPKDMQLEEFDVYKESSTISVASNGCRENGLQDSSDDNCSVDVDDASFPACSSESSINNGNIDKKWKVSKKSSYFYPVKENDSVGSEVKEEVVYTNFRSIFFNTSDTPTCGSEKSLLPLRLKNAAGTSNGCFDSYWKYKSTPNPSYADAERCLRVALHSSPPVMAALLPLIQILLLGNKLKDALCELEKICCSSTTALPFRLRGRLVECYYQDQVSTISCCYEEALRRDPSCSYSVERLTEMHRKGYYNTVLLIEAIALHLDSVNGKPVIWEELVSCFIRLFSDRTTGNEDCNSFNVEGDAAINAFSSLSSVFCEQHTKESWKLRCRWWMNHHFSQNSYMSETMKGDCKLLASKAGCASHLVGPEFQYVEAVTSYLSKQEATAELGFLSRNMQNSVRLLDGLEKLA